jgi:malonyl-CoA/methylmalonyl-CoA synthetase|tara:strand:+ start:3207 stop:4769 length:1563 start_codon:yes stop_codon:yes gene_type:complete
MTSSSSSPTRQLHTTTGDNFFHRLTRDWHTHLDKELFILPGQRAMSYRAALDHTQRLAAVLVSLGVEPGDRVAVQVDKSPMAVLLYLACLQVGSVYIPLNASYTQAEISYFINDAAPRLFVHGPEFKTEFFHSSAQMRLATLDANGVGSLTQNLTTIEPLSVVEKMAADNLASILYTSGTTGRSKGAMLTHDNLSSNCQALIDCWKFGEQDILIHALPIFHIHGLFVACNMVLASAASMVFLASFKAQEVLEYLPQATVLMGVPTFYTRLLKDSNLGRGRCQKTRLFVSGSAPLAVDTHEQFQQRTGQAVLERYGMTETGMICSNPYDGVRKAGTVGFPLTGVELRIADRVTATELAHGEVGMIEVRGPNVFKGYWRMPEKTAEEFRNDGFFITGDLGHIDKDGYLHIVGRDKDLVISGGYNIYPKEIELQIDALSGVIESAVIGLPHDDFGEAVTAVVVLAPNAPLQEVDIKAQIAVDLAKYKQPKRVLIVDVLPHNTMGKVMKNELRNFYAGLYQKIK